MKFSIISVLLSLLTLFLSIKANLDILNDYLSADGKTQALFGFTELKYSSKYYFLIILLISLLLIRFAFKNKELYKFRYSAIFVLIVGGISIVVDFWKWFI